MQEETDGNNVYDTLFRKMEGQLAQISAAQRVTPGFAREIETVSAKIAELHTATGAGFADSR